MKAPRWPWGNKARWRAKTEYLLKLDQVLAAAEVVVENIKRLIETVERRP